MKTILQLLLAAGLVWWLSHNTFVLPYIGLVQFSWSAAMCGLVLLYAVIMFLPWISRATT
jgi:hypothetical protein